MLNISLLPHYCRTQRDMQNIWWKPICYIYLLGRSYNTSNHMMVYMNHLDKAFQRHSSLDNNIQDRTCDIDSPSNIYNQCIV